MKLLIVEDNRGIRGLLKRVVADCAASIHECEDGAEALAAYAACRPDWVLMDIEMPRLDGITATRQIKAAFPDARILILTQYADAELREAARQAGAYGYVTKDDLFEVREFLQSAGASLTASRVG